MGWTYVRDHRYFKACIYVEKLNYYNLNSYDGDILQHLTIHLILQIVVVRS